MLAGEPVQEHRCGDARLLPRRIRPYARADRSGDPREDTRRREARSEGRYAATLPADTYEKAEKALGDTARCEEDVLSYIVFPQVAEDFFAKRREREERVVSYSITEL